MKAAIYARFSSDNQREESIDAQVRAIKDYAKINNIQITKIYTDEARSATTDDRPQFLQMIKDSEFGVFDSIVVHKLDRFSRNRYDSAFYKKKLKDNNIRLVSVLERLDESPESIILESVLEGMAEYYSKNLSREVMKGMKETALQCKHNGGTPPLGYDVSKDKTYLINEDEAKAVRLIFERYSNDVTYSLILDELKLLGFKTKLNKPFGKNSLYSILTNEKYVGTYVFNKSSKKQNGKRNSHKTKDEDEIIKIENGMPAIISKETWEKVQIKMQANKHLKGSKTAKSLYLLSGLIYCEKCGSAMTGNRRFSGRNKTLYETYECSNRKRTKQCDAKSINKDYVEQLVIDDLYKNILSKEATKKLAKDILEFTAKESKTINEDLKLYKKNLVDIEAQLKNIVNAICAGLFNPTMKDSMDALENEKALLTARITEVEHQSKLNAPTEEMIIAYLKRHSDIKEKSLDDQRKIIQTYVSKVTVNEDNITTYTIVTAIGGGEGN